MRDTSRRAARPAARGGLPNVRFAVSSLEALPGGLDSVANLVTVHFPWGSLRTAAAGHDPGLTARIASLVRPGGHLRLILSSGPRDGDADVDPDGVASAYAAHGLLVREVRPATFDDAVAAHSSWGKRLLRRPAPGRLAWAFDLERAPSVRVGTARIEP